MATEEPSRGELFQVFEADLARQTGVPFAFPSNFRFGEDALRDRGGTPRQDRIFGIDISRYQGSNFPLRDLRTKQISFVYVKATQGTHIKDESFARNWSELEGLANQPESKRVYRGAYHFLSADDDGAAQAERFVAYTALHGGIQPSDLLPALDLEWDKACKTCDDRWSKYSPAQIIEQVRSFRKRLKELIGRAPVVYTNKGFLNGIGITADDQLASLLEGGKAWIFDLNAKDAKLELPDPKKNLDHRLWQFSWSAYVPGHAGDVDVDVFSGSEDEFRHAVLGSE